MSDSESNQARMQILESQVKHLTNAMTVLTGLSRKLTKNGAKRVSLERSESKKRIRKRTTNGSSKSSSAKVNSNAKKSKSSVNNNRRNDSKLHEEVDEYDDVEDDVFEEKINTNLVPSPITFQYNDMEDLKQLKTDLENLNGLL